MLHTIIIYLLSVMVTLYPATHLEAGWSFAAAADNYYEPLSLNGWNEYGYATRYGSDEVAFWELRWEADEAAKQAQRGWILPGGGYGFFYIDDVHYLVENRASKGYAILADRYKPFHAKYATENQKRLLMLSGLGEKRMREYVEQRYIGIISVRSPNDIGAEFCIYDVAHQELVGLAIAGGAAARNDYTYFGPSLNDHYGHERLGMRTLRPRESQFYYLKDISPELYETDFYWIADISDSIYNRISAGMGATARLIALMEPKYCE